MRTYRQGHLRQRGLTRAEFVLAALALSLIAGSLLTALLYAEELSEAAVVQLTIQNVRSGLRYQIADRLVGGRTAQMGELLKANPVSWVESSPAGYVGTVKTADIASLPRGSWFYDADRAELGYIPKLSFHLSVDNGEESILRWRVKALRSDAPWSVEGLMVVAVTPYRWY